MSTQTNQYLIYGVRKPFEWSEEWEAREGRDFYDTFESFMEDSAFSKEVTHKDGIFCIFDGRDGRFILIGRVICKSQDGGLLAEDGPLSLPDFTSLEVELLKDSIERNFGIREPLNFYFVTLYR